jgi:predicted phosphodiesterase
MSFKKFLVCADNHGNLVNQECFSKFRAFKKDWKPDYTICLGDLWNLDSLRKSATDEERREGIKADFEAGFEFLDIGFNYLTLGNHDARLWEAAEGSPNGILRESCQNMVKAATSEFKSKKIKWVPYNVNSYLQLPEGGPKLLHGFLAGQNPAKAHFDRFGSCLFGHIHSPSTFTATNIDGGQAYSLPCMADIESMKYADRFPNRLGWRNGWGFGIINTKTGKWSFWNVIKEDGSYISPMGIL